MLKKFGAFLLAVIVSASLFGCKGKTETAEVEEHPWLGSYVLQNEETGEIKTAVITAEDETGVTVSFKSVRSKDEFYAEFKSKSSKYAVCNLEDRCIKFNLKSGNTVVSVDDIWINKDAKRTENWTGKYTLAENGETDFEYGNPKWNGEYENPESGLMVSVYAITKSTVLLSYVANGEEGREKTDIVCGIDDDSHCTFEDDGRKIEICLKKANKELEITDSYGSNQSEENKENAENKENENPEAEETEFIDLCGIYTAK